MFLLVYSTIKIRDTQRLPLHLQSRKDQLKSFQYRLRRLQSQLVILPCKNAGRKKKIRLWSTLFSSSTPKNDTCDREEDFAAIWRKKHRKRIKRPLSDKTTKNFWLNDDPRGLFSSSKNVSSTEKWSSSLQREFPHPRSDKVFSTRTVISQHSNRRFRHQTLHLHHQRRQLYKQEEEWFQNFSAVKKNFEHERQHVNNVTRAVISESEDFEHQEETVRHRNSKLFSLSFSNIFLSFVFVKKEESFPFPHRLFDIEEWTHGPVFILEDKKLSVLGLI